MQIHILRQVAPLLSLKPMRRLSKIHDVVYLETDRSKQLRRRLLDFLTPLERGKQPNDTLSLAGSRKKARARQNAHLRAERPQLVSLSI